MLVLNGFALSNYHNKVKLALLEKGVPFEERVVPIRSQDPAVLAASPLGKIPFLTTPHGPLSETTVQLEWIEAAYPEPPLLPSDPYAAAKVRELGTFIDLHLELVARELYAQAFFGGQVSDAVQQSVRHRLDRAIPAFARLARFAPYVAGDTFTLADCTAFAHLPVVSMATRAIYGEDLLASAGVDVKAYTTLVGQRPSAQRVVADRKAAQAQGIPVA